MVEGSLVVRRRGVREAALTKKTAHTRSWARMGHDRFIGCVGGAIRGGNGGGGYEIGVAGWLVWFG